MDALASELLASAASIGLSLARGISEDALSRAGAIGERTVEYLLTDPDDMRRPIARRNLEQSCELFAREMAQQITATECQLTALVQAVVVGIASKIKEEIL